MRSPRERLVAGLALVLVSAQVVRAWAGCAPVERVWISEILYDASGDDTGFEYVELANPTDHPLPLAGLRLEAGDGAGPGRWTTRWTGAVADTLPPHQRFVIGGARVSPIPQAIVTLDLQNGPDAVRLVWPDGAFETVGYGALAYDEYFCGAPAADVASGQALARVPDDADTGSNATDFRADTPTPGRANQPARDLAIVPGSLALAPPHPHSGEIATLGGRALVRGRDDLADSGRVVGGWVTGADTTWSAATSLPALAAGDSFAFAWTLAPPDGELTLLARAELAGDEDPMDDLDTLRVRVGPGPLELSEIQFHPLGGEEWVEVRAWDRGEVVPAGFTLRDRSGTTALARGGRPLAPGERAILAPHRAAFIAAHPGLDSTRVLEATPWPSLNNNDGPDGIADVLTLGEPDGTPADVLAYAATGVPAGVPLERLDDTHWAPSTLPGGTPLEPPRPPPAIARRFEALPARLDVAAPRGRLAWALEPSWVWLSVHAYDLAGRDAGPVLARALRAGRGETDWDAGAWPPGVYLLVLTAEPERGGSIITATTAVRIVRRIP